MAFFYTLQTKFRVYKTFKTTWPKIPIVPFIFVASQVFTSSDYFGVIYTSEKLKMLLGMGAERNENGEIGLKWNGIRAIDAQCKQ